jgi:protein O-GlcNAc transferase
VKQDLFQLATQQHRSGQLPDAEALYRQVLAEQPEHADVLSQLGYLLNQTGRHADALHFIERAVAKEPSAAEYLNNLALTLVALNRLDDAIAAYNKAAKLRPDLAEIHCGLGAALVRNNHPHEAITALQRALAIQPNNGEAYLQLGTALRAVRRWDESLAAFRRAVEFRPGDGAALSNLAAVYWEFGLLEDALACVRGAIAANPADAAAHSNLLMMLHYRNEEDAGTIESESRQWDRCHAMPLRSAQLVHENNHDANRRLRVRYVSSDFRLHSVAFFIENLLMHHTPDQVETFCYAQVMPEDAVTDRLRAAAHHWRNILGVSDAQVAELIRADGIDILVDLAGHTSNRLLVFARKPAPIQVTYLGYPNKTDLGAMDYRLTDALADPPESEAAPGPGQSAEQLVRLPRSFLSFRPFSDSPDVADPPALTAGFVTFGSFNQLAKLSRPTIEVWAEILRRIPSRLILKSRGLSGSTAREILMQRFAEFGVAHQLELRPFAESTANHLRQYNEIDIGLDSFPYSGTTTTCEALWMGVPAVTLAGNTHVGRVGVSILSSAGYPQWIARARRQYVEIAVQLAEDLPALTKYRRELRPNLEKSPLMDGPAFVRDVEAAFRQMWHTWLQKQT